MLEQRVGLRAKGVGADLLEQLPGLAEMCDGLLSVASPQCQRPEVPTGQGDTDGVPSAPPRPESLTEQRCGLVVAAELGTRRCC